MKETVLITGCCGYTGSKMCTLFLKKGYNVVGLDLFIRETEQNKPIKKIKADLRDKEELKKLKDISPDYIIHTAADQISDNIFNNNVAMSDNLITFAKQKKAKGFIFLSSSLASTPAYIQYAKSKVVIETNIHDSKIPYIIIRPDMFYSFDEKKMNELKGFMRKHFTIAVGNGKYLRTPTYVFDLVDFCHQIIKEKKFTNKVYEFGSPTSYSQNQILKMMAKEMNKKIFIMHLPIWLTKIIFKVTRKVDPEQMQTIHYDRVANLQRLKEDFNIIPKDFADGVKLLMHGEK